jgi:acetyl esterase/lipase
MSDDILTLPSPPADRRIPYGSYPNQFLDLRMPTGKSSMSAPPLVINIHGGFWRARYDLNHAGHICAALARRGIATANVEYRRVGNPGGGWPGTFGDICSAFEFLVTRAEEHNIDAGRILIMGHSAGGELALCLAAREKRITGAIALAGVVDLHAAYELYLSNDAVAEFLGGSPKKVPKRYREADPMQLSVKVPQFLFHGSADNEVPPDFSRAYVAAKKKLSGLKKESVRLVEIAGAGHYELIDPRTSAWLEVEETVLHVLQPT